MCLTVSFSAISSRWCAAGFLFQGWKTICDLASLASSQQRGANQRNMRQKSMDEKPLTDSEVRMTTGLLYRAVCHGQAEAVIETYRAPMVPIRFHAGAVSLMNDMQMFTGLANCAKEIYATQSAIPCQNLCGKSLHRWIQSLRKISPG